MKKNKKRYFFYFNELASGKLYTYIFLNFFVGLMDGIGLTLFIPLIYIATSTDSGEESSGKMHYITDAFTDLNIPLNIYTILLLMILVFVFKGALSYLRSIYATKTAQITARNIRFSLIKGLRIISYEGFTALDSGIVQNNMTAEANRLIQASSLYMSAVQNIAMLVIYLLMAIVSNWQFAVLVAIGGLISNFLYKYLNTLTINNAQKISGIGRNFQAYLLQSLYNFKYLKATNYYEAYNEKLKKEITDSENVQYKIGKISAVSDNMREPIIIIIISMVLIFQLKVLNGDMSSMMAALLLFYRSLGHLANFQSFWNKFLTNIPARDSVDQMLESFHENSEVIDKGVTPVFGDISVKDLSLSYGSHQVLDHISLTVQNRSSIALIGESGAGKTTLANVICGLIRPKEGKMFINGTDIREINVGRYRQKVGYVTQEPVIFDDTLFNNITFFEEKNENSLAKFGKAVEMASLGSFLSRYPEREDVQLGNNGILISGGQKQRISIARELYKDIDLMILDEATSALDSETEKFIKDQIDFFHGKFTMVIIAHRLSTIKNVDMIYLMENGKIAASGSYQELYDKSEKFRSMVKLQNMTDHNSDSRLHNADLG